MEPRGSPARSHRVKDKAFSLTMEEHRVCSNKRLRKGTSHGPLVWFKKKKCRVTRESVVGWKPRDGGYRRLKPAVNGVERRRGEMKTFAFGRHYELQTSPIFLRNNKTC